MAKIVLIGAGSHSFSKNLITDIISYPELRDSTVTLMDIAKEPLELATSLAVKLVKQQGFNTKIESTTDRQEALKGANYVIVAIRVGGAASMKMSGIPPDPAAFFTARVTSRQYWTSAAIWKNFARTPG